MKTVGCIIDRGLEFRGDRVWEGFNPNAEDVRLVPRLAVSMQLKAKS